MSDEIEMDEFKVRFPQWIIRPKYLKDRIKAWWIRRLVKWARGIMTKHDQLHLDRCEIGEQILLNIRKYVPDDGEWHHVAMTIDYWIKIRKRKVKKEVKKVFVDGKEQDNANG